jgi:DNA-binding beta-propeller fold protein YncE
VTTDREGLVYVADFGNNRVQVFSPDGHFIRAWGHAGDGPGDFDWPLGIAIGPEGTVLVLDTDNSRIQRFTPDGKLIEIWGHTGKEVGEFLWPDGIAVSPNGTVVVADTANGRLQVRRPGHSSTIGEMIPRVFWR